MVDWKYSSKELGPTFGPSSGLWVSQRKVRRGGRTIKKDTHTQPTQKQQEKLFKCQKTFANPTNFAHAHICTASRALFHTKSVGWHYLRSKSCPDIFVGASRHAWCDSGDFDLICDLNQNCDISGAHSIWICDADPWDETSDSSMSNLLWITSLSRT